MANVYVWSGATGGGTGADWTNAYTTLVSACAAKSAGDIFFVAHDHNETAASAKTITSPGSDPTPCKIYCVNRAGSVPPVSADLRTTAIVATTGASNITFGNSFSEVYGLDIRAGDAANAATINIGAASNRSVRLVNCKLKLNNTSTSSRITFNSTASGAAAYMENTTLEFGSVSQQAQSLARTYWTNTPSALVGATIPTTLFAFNGGQWFVEGVDLSAAGSGKSLFSAVAAINPIAVIKDCKLGASVGILQSFPTSRGAADITMINCDSGDINYRTEKHCAYGIQIMETVIVRTGGASDGTTPVAWKIVTQALSRPECPFEALPISIWNETIGTPITITIQGTWSTAGVPTNADIWLEAEYLGTSGFPLGNRVSSGRADTLATATNLAAGSGTWGGSTNPFSTSVTLTAQEKGSITLYVRAGKGGTTFWIDPKPVVT